MTAAGIRVCATVLVTMALSPLAGQSGANTGAIIGEVSDPSSAPVAGAEVIARNRDTNFTRSTTTDVTGRYVLASLSLGPYEVSVRKPGLQLVRNDAFVSLGSSVTLNFSLALAPKTDELEVTSGTVGIEPARSAPKSILTDLQIHQLPSNGRRLQNMVIQTPTALIEPECRGFSISGQKGIYSNVSIDGGDYNSTWGCGIRARSESAPSFGLEALQEIQVVRNTFNAEFGRSTGGEIQMSTRSGTNVFHGSAFELLRSGQLAASDPFGRTPISRLNQFGGSLGGPIRRNRTFFFTAAEFQLGTKPVQILYPLLDSQGVRDTPAARALLSVAPETTVTAISNAQSVINRLDHTLSDTHSLFARFDFTRTVQTNSPGATNLSTGLGIASATNAASSNQLTQPDANYTVLGQMTSSFSSTRINELRVQFSRESRPRVHLGGGPQVTVNNTQSGTGGTVAIYGAAPQGSWGNVGFASTDHRYQTAENLTMVRGAHVWKTGVDYQRIAGTARYDQTAGGAYTFNSLTDLLNRNPSIYTQFTGTGAVDVTIHQIGGYIQDQWRLRPGLTLNPGLRYEAQLNPNYYAATAAANRYPLATYIPHDTAMLAPRLGLAWDVGNAGRTVIRAGAGLFYAPTYASLFAQSILFNGGNPDRAYSVSVTSASALSRAFASSGVNLVTAPLGNLPVFGPDQYNRLVGAGTGLNSVSYFDPAFRNPRALQVHTEIERELARGITIAQSFTLINTVRVARERDTNLGPPVVDAPGRNIYSNPRPNSAFGVSQITESAGRSLYRGFTTTLNVRRKRYTVDVYYTRSWNFSYDDVERGFTAVRYADANNIRSEYNYSNIDEPSQFLVNANYSLPHGIEVAGIMRFTSGRPYNAVVGTDVNRDGANTDRPVPGGVLMKRNMFRNEGLRDVSLRLQKSFSLNERGRISLSGEFFNLFNFRNMQLSGAAFTYGPNLTPLPAFGQLKDSLGRYYQYNLPGDPFQAQLGVRYQF